MEEVKEKLDTLSQRIGLTWMGGMSFLVLAVVLLLGQVFMFDTLYWVITLIVSGLVFTALFVVDRDHWWGLIPAYGLIITGIFLAVGGDEYTTWAGSFWAFAICLPFVVIYATAPTRRRWALIPAYAMLVIGAGLLLADVLTAFWLPGYLLFCLALPFLAMYTSAKRQTWMLITGGILATIGAGYAVAAIEAFIPVFFAVCGVFLLARQVSRRRAQSAQVRREQAPAYGPEADRADFEPISAPASSSKASGD